MVAFFTFYITSCHGLFSIRKLIPLTQTKFLQYGNGHSVFFSSCLPISLSSNKSSIISATTSPGICLFARVVLQYVLAINFRYLSLFPQLTANVQMVLSSSHCPCSFKFAGEKSNPHSGKKAFKCPLTGLSRSSFLRASSSLWLANSQISKIHS